eukprot:TRINITY_DN6859_c0_g1_i2.p1 TRINITY_DN6859_c0_g1~~TRINITY_DN6859_c0_g1_i2.p1  ORF type:complete len:598 (+),score=129.71 TRINITY_DN6859_c0_g1_i2:340-2133(+)
MFTMLVITCRPSFQHPFVVILTLTKTNKQNFTPKQLKWYIESEGLVAEMKKPDMKRQVREIIAFKLRGEPIPKSERTINYAREMRHKPMSSSIDIARPLIPPLFGGDSTAQPSDVSPFFPFLPIMKSYAPPKEEQIINQHAALMPSIAIPPMMMLPQNNVAVSSSSIIDGTTSQQLPFGSPPPPSPSLTPSVVLPSPIPTEPIEGPEMICIECGKRKSNKFCEFRLCRGCCRSHANPCPPHLRPRENDLPLPSVPVFSPLKPPPRSLVNKTIVQPLSSPQPPSRPLPTTPVAVASTSPIVLRLPTPGSMPPLLPTTTRFRVPDPLFAIPTSQQEQDITYNVKIVSCPSPGCEKEYPIAGSELWVHVASEHPEVFHAFMSGHRYDLKKKRRKLEDTASNDKGKEEENEASSQCTVKEDEEEDDIDENSEQALQKKKRAILGEDIDSYITRFQKRAKLNAKERYDRNCKYMSELFAYRPIYEDVRDLSNQILAGYLRRKALVNFIENTVSSSQQLYDNLADNIKRQTEDADAFQQQLKELEGCQTLEELEHCKNKFEKAHNVLFLPTIPSLSHPVCLLPNDVLNDLPSETEEKKKYISL